MAVWHQESPHLQNPNLPNRYHHLPLLHVLLEETRMSQWTELVLYNSKDPDHTQHPFPPSH